MRLREFAHPKKSMLAEGARIQHAEDWVFWEGSKGAKRTVDALRSLAQEGHKDVSIKWDGSPAVVFGRDEDGEFVFTDKSGFTAKGYDGKAKSADDLESMLKGRPGYQKNPKVYGEFASKMKGAFDAFERAVPEDHRGFFKGDMLYFSKPAVEGKNFVFKPNVVEYRIDVESDLGKRIARSTAGVVIHREVDIDGTESPLQDTDIFQGNDVLVMPPVSVEAPAEIPTDQVDKLEANISKNAAAIDEFLNSQELRQKQLTDLPKLLYAYLNSKVDTGLTNLGADFTTWLETAKISEKKKANVLAHINQHMPAFKAMWETISAVITVKDNIIKQFDAQSKIKQSIGGAEGGEGYVLAHPEGDIKLVPREFFTKANRAMQR
jgi:hypothetical protein